MSSTRLLLEKVSAFRNPVSDLQRVPCGRAALAECAFIVLIPYAIVEAAIAHVAVVIAGCARIENRRYQSINSWATSSAYCMLWVIYATAVNLFVRQIVATEAAFIAALNQRFRQMRNIPPSLTWNNDHNVLRTRTGTPFVINPPAVDPQVAQILNNYELGDNARKYSDAYERLYRNLPEPTTNELNNIGTQIADLVRDRCNERKRNEIKTYLETIVRKSNRNEWENRFIKMVTNVHRVIIAANNPSDLEILKEAIKDSWEHCINRRTSEFETLTAYYVVGAQLNNLTLLDALMYEMTQHRNKLSDIIITGYCDDGHNAASKVVMRRECNQSVFHLPPPILSSLDYQYANFAMQEQKPLIIEAFRRCYDSPNTIYTVLDGLLYPRPGENFKFTPSRFVSEYLEPNGLMNVDAFEDPEEMTRYKTQLKVNFLVSQGFLRLKQRPAG
jgi:hypothetical protein